MTLTIMFAIVATEATTEILLHSTLLEKPRAYLCRFSFFNKLFDCGWCLSLWVALVVFIIMILGWQIVFIPIVLHRLSNFLHDGYQIIKRKKQRS